MTLLMLAFGEAEHYQSGGGLVDERVCIGLEDGRGLGAGALDDLVLEFQNQPLGALEADSLDTFDLVDILREDGVTDFIGGQRETASSGRN
jgi:hypothetical protein